MDPERWHKIERLISAALEKEPAERAAFLSEACAQDESLRAEVESLLAHDKGVGSLLEAPAMEMAAREITAGPAPVEALPSMVGKTLGHYQITTQIGKGGMGEVFQAKDRMLGRDVAIKVLPDIFTSDPERLARFDREATLLASLNHPNVETIHGIEQAGTKRFLVLELVQGETLAQRLAKGPLRLEEALEICHQIAEGLQAAHGKGIIHRDLKPANVKVTPEGRVKVLDFGLAKAARGTREKLELSQAQTETGPVTSAWQIVGTPGYMSPEQARGCNVDQRADIWAFGCLLYELLCGKGAFKGEKASDTIAAVLGNEPDWQVLPAKTPARVRDLLRQCLQKDVNRRPSSISAAPDHRSPKDIHSFDTGRTCHDSLGLLVIQLHSQSSVGQRRSNF